MKNFLFPFSFFLIFQSHTLSGQLEINYNQQTNTLEINNENCLSCIYNAEGARICQCKNDCIDQEYEDCYLECQNEPYPQDEYYCQLECDERFGYTNRPDYEGCFLDCGTSLKPFREVIAYSYTIVSDFAPIPVHPFSTTTIANIVTGGPFNINLPNDPILVPDIQLPPPWPEANSTLNTCYSVIIDIFYISGPGTISRCRNSATICNIIG